MSLTWQRVGSVGGGVFGRSTEGVLSLQRDVKRPIPLVTPRGAPRELSVVPGAYRITLVYRGSSYYLRWHYQEPGGGEITFTGSGFTDANHYLVNELEVTAPGVVTPFVTYINSSSNRTLNMNYFAIWLTPLPAEEAS